MIILDFSLKFIQKISGWKNKYENTIDYVRESSVAHAKIPGLNNLGMIIRKYTSKDNGKHLITIIHCVHPKACNYNKEAMVTRRIFKKEINRGDC